LGNREDGGPERRLVAPIYLSRCRGCGFLWPREASGRAVLISVTTATPNFSPPTATTLACLRDFRHYRHPDILERCTTTAVTQVSTIIGDESNQFSAGRRVSADSIAWRAPEREFAPRVIFKTTQSHNTRF
jgi:hypothetical protein